MPRPRSTPTRYSERLRDEGVIPAGVRFQVCLPTPMASAFMYVAPASIPAYLPAYERALLRRWPRSAAAIPHADLSIQWDICQEVLVFEGYFPWRPDDYKARSSTSWRGSAMRCRPASRWAITCATARPRTSTSSCRGSRHLRRDRGRALEAGLTRSLDYLHLPVPKDRTDDAYFAPLDRLKLPPETQLYLGLIHHDDNAGDRARIAAAKRHWPRFGVATECGWGRAEPARVPGLLRSHRLALEG